MNSRGDVACQFCGKIFTSRKALGGHIGALSRSGDSSHYATPRVGGKAVDMEVPKATRKAPVQSVEQRILGAEALVRAANEKLEALRNENVALKEELEALQTKYESEHFKAQLDRMEEAEEQLRKNLEADREQKSRTSWLRGRKP